MLIYLLGTLTSREYSMSEKISNNASLADSRDVLSPREVQQMLGIGRNATYELLASGRLASIRVTQRRIVVTKRALEEFLGLSAKRVHVGQ
jgi:excisionase family DNA binding protein